MSSTSIRNMSELHKVCERRDWKKVTSLLNNENINTQNREGETPLHIASKDGDLDTVKVLASRKECDLNIPDEQGNTPLHLACYIKALSIAKLLLEQRCNTNNPNQKEKEIPNPLRPFLNRRVAPTY